MDKQEIAKEIKETEDRLAELRAKLEKKRVRQAEPGDVVLHQKSGNIYIVGEINSMLIQSNYFNCFDGDCAGSKTFSEEGDVFLGKFWDVFVKRQDVIDAMKVQDSVGDSLYSWVAETGNTPYHAATKKLAKLLKIEQ